MAGSKLYQVVDIDFSDLKIEARETDLDVSDVLKNEVFRLEDLEEFYVASRNRGEKVVDFGEWVKVHGNSRKYQLYNEFGSNRIRK